MTEMVTLGAYNLVTLGVYNLVSPVCRNNMLPKMIVRSLRMDSNDFFFMKEGTWDSRGHLLYQLFM